MPEFQASDNQIINIFDNKDNKELRSCLDDEAGAGHLSAPGGDKRPKTSDNVNFNPRRGGDHPSGAYGDVGKKGETS